MIKTLSIVTPSYNQGKFIEETLKSIWSQKGDFELEHIIADGGSTDETLKIIKKYDRLYKTKRYLFKYKKFAFRWWSKKDKGQTDAINQGFKIAKGEIVNWINSDDTLCPNALERVFKTFNSHKTDIVVGKGYLIDEKSKVVGETSLLSKISKNQEFQKILPRIQKGDFLIQQSVFFRKKLLQKCPLDIDLHFCMDWDLYLRFYLKKFRFYFINQYLGAIREQKKAKTMVMPKGVYQERLLIYQKNRVWSAGRIHSFLKLKAYKNKMFSNFIDKLTNVIKKVLIFYNNRKLIKG